MTKSAWALYVCFALPLACAAPTQPPKALVQKYCVTCHNTRARTGNLALDEADQTPIADHSEVWEKVVRKVQGGFMPPAGAPRPDQPTLNQFVSGLEASLDEASVAHPYPGRVVLHRMNRAEYANAVRDLLALEVDIDSILPPDDSNNGFDNMAQSLNFSPTLLEGYLRAALKVSSLAVGDPSIGPTADTFRVRGDLSQDVHAPGLPLGTRGGLLVHYNFPLDGEYVFKTKLKKSNRGLLRGIETPSELEVSLDGRRLLLKRVGGKEDEAASDVNPPVFALEVEKRFDLRIPVTAGPHTLAVAFINESSAEKIDMTQPYIRDKENTQAVIGVPEVDTVTVGGPFKPTGVGRTPTRERIFSCRPTSLSTEAPCARKILTVLARRAYRRAPTASEIDLLLTLFRDERKKRGSFDRGIQRAVAQVLTNPQFLFRFEPDPSDLPVNGVFRLDDTALASRLSFFLWSSIPDDELLNLAIEQKLHDPAVLEQQVKRMLADDRSEALIRNFVGQWLYLRNLKNVIPDQNLFPDFDDNLRQSFQRETEMFCDSIMRGDRNLLELLNADYTFLNERLAKHYGIPGIYGDQFRRVTLTDDARRGLLGQGSVLTVTSYATRTAPVLRGKWILTNVLGNPPPPPPPNVPALQENVQGKALSMKERMEQHRANAACATCHKVMDPLGFNLESFDAVGHFRKTDGGAPVDTTSVFPDGTLSDGVVSLRERILQHPEQFMATVTERLMAYALGRSTEFYDMPAVRRIVKNSEAHDYVFSSVVIGLVESVPFQMKIKVEPSTEGPS